MKIHKRTSVRGGHTSFSGGHTLVILSIPTAANFLPSQLHATCVMDCGEGTRTSRGRNTEKVGGYGSMCFSDDLFMSAAKEFIRECRERRMRCVAEEMADAEVVGFHAHLYRFDLPWQGSMEAMPSCWC
jgi:hypothetical protein